MSEEEKDILFDIDMQLYNEFNDTIAPMYDHLGEIYTLRDIEEVEKAEKEKEIKLLRGAIKELQKENQQLKDDQLWSEATIEWLKERFIPKEKVDVKIKEYLNKAVTVESIRIARQTTKEEDQEIKLYRTVADVLRELVGGINNG